MPSLIDNLQFAIFTSSAPLGKGLAVWSRLFERDPDALNSMPNGGQQISGRIDELQLHLQIQPGRIDLMLQGADELGAAVPPTIQKLPEAVALGKGYISRALQEGVATRVAFVMNTHQAFTTDDEVRAQLISDLPNIPIPPNSADIQYHCTQRRELAGFESKKINCICRWVAGRIALVTFDPSKMATGPIVMHASPSLSRYIDVATSNEFTVAVEEISPTLDALTTEAIGILEGGYEYLLS